MGITFTALSSVITNIVSVVTNIDPVVTTATGSIFTQEPKNMQRSSAMTTLGGKKRLWLLDNVGKSFMYTNLCDGFQYHRFNVPVNLIGFGHSRDLTIARSNVQPNSTQAYDYLFATPNYNFNIDNIKFGYFNPTFVSDGSLDGNITRIGQTNHGDETIIRNFKAHWYSSSLKWGGGMKYVTIAKNYKHEEIDRQIIVTPNDNRLHYICLLKIRMKIYNTDSGTRSIPFHEFHPYNKPISNQVHLSPGQKILMNNPSFLKDADVTLLVHFKYRTDVGIHPVFEGSSILNQDDLLFEYSNTSDNFRYTSPGYGFEYGEVLGYEPRGIDYWAKSYIRIKRLYDENLPNLRSKYPVNQAGDTLNHFECYLENNNLRVAVQNSKVNSEVTIYEYDGSDWSKASKTNYKVGAFYASMFKVTDSASAPNFAMSNSNASPAFSDGIAASSRGNGYLGAISSSDNTKWTVLRGTRNDGGGMTKSITWDDVAASFNVTNVGPRDPSVDVVALATLTHNSFRYTNTVIGNSLHSFVRYGSTNIHTSFPLNTFENRILIATKNDNYTGSEETAISLYKVTVKDDYYTYEETSPLSAVLSSVETKFDGTTVDFVITLDYSADGLSTSQLDTLVNSVDLWKFYSTSPSEEIKVNRTVVNAAGNGIEFSLDIASLIGGENSVVSKTIILHGIDHNWMPFCATSDSDIDARQINLSRVYVEYMGQEYDAVYGASKPTYSSSIIRTTAEDLRDNDFRILADGDLSTIYSAQLQFTPNQINFNNVPGTTRALSLVSGSFDSSESFPLPLTDTLNVNDTTGLLINGVKLKGRGSAETQRSLTDFIHGLSAGPTLTLINSVGESVYYSLPPISLSNGHKFIVAPSGNNTRIIEVDTVDDADFNDVITHNQIYTTPNDSSNYVFSFNFRCAPNYVDQDNKYTLYYENNTNVTIYHRISTPVIKSWNLIAVPVGSTMIYPDSSLKLVSDVSTLSSDSNKEIYFKGGKLCKTVTQNEENNYGKSTWTTYLTDTDCSGIVYHLSHAILGESEYNEDCQMFYTSGSYTEYVDAPGYVDVVNTNFEYGPSGVAVTDGIIPSKTYSIFFIVQDTAGVWTGIDLVKSMSRYDNMSHPYVSSDSFNYGV